MIEKEVIEEKKNLKAETTSTTMPVKSGRILASSCYPKLGWPAGFTIPTPESPPPPHLEASLDVGAIVTRVEKAVKPSQKNLLLHRQWQRQYSVAKPILNEVAIESFAGTPHPSKVLVEGFQPRSQQQAPCLLRYQNLAFANAHKQP